MTLHEFISLSEQEQTTALWDGSFFLWREEKEHTILLYKLHGFYVEVYYSNETNKITRLNPFNSKKRLELYFVLQQN